jgi:hypothetical protein
MELVRMSESVAIHSKKLESHGRVKLCQTFARLGTPSALLARGQAKEKRPIPRRQAQNAKTSFLLSQYKVKQNRKPITPSLQNDP